MNTGMKDHRAANGDHGTDSWLTGAVAIVLCLGTLGCAGLGTQQTSALHAGVRAQDDLGSLWMSTQPSTGGGVRMRRHAGNDLRLWERGAEPEARFAPNLEHNSVDLWRPVAAEHSERVPPHTYHTVSAGSLFSDVGDGKLW